ncbi:FMN-dependent NADH-azoreductase [Luteolibacter soli]|uniref:FMN dependent NADH:quinone oxidoreductase n=1 Tax=Luteolibacter soli TaxID=3135280 RepID=A0ABU9B147_9BACT
MKLLHIDSSITGNASVSRLLTAELVQNQKSLHPGLEVVYRDLAATPLQHLSGNHLAAAHGGDGAGADLAEGAAILEEFLAADIVVIGAPMYNFSVPSQLKAWIDRLAVQGKTFRYSEKGAEGLAGGKKVWIASSRGASFAGGPLQALDHQESYLQAFLGFLGITEIKVIRAENLGRTDQREKSIEAARSEIAALAA